MTFSNLLFLSSPSRSSSSARRSGLVNGSEPESGSTTRSIFLQAIVYCALLIFFSETAAGQTDLKPKNASGVDFSDWILKQPTGAEAEFKMPTKPRYVERTFTPVQNQPPIKVRNHIGSIEFGELIFNYHDLHKTPSGTKEIAKTLDGAVSGGIAIVAGKLISENQRIKYGKYQGRQFTYLYAANQKVLRVTARVFIVGRRQYMVAGLMEDDKFDEEKVNLFLNSFRIVKPDSDLPPKPSVQAKTLSNG